MTTKPPSLEAVSESAPERRRVLRLNLTREQFRLSDNGKIFSVIDLSAGGMALRVLAQEDLFLFPVGRAFRGTLNLHREKVPVSARVRHVGGDLVGCEFDPLEPKTVAALERFFDPRQLGQELTPMPSASSEGGTLWYHGLSGTDLILWRGIDKGDPAKADLAGGQFYRIALFLQGSYAQWESGKGVSTGRMANAFEHTEVRGVLRFETMLLSADEKPDARKLEVAKTVILSSNLTEELKKWSIRQLAT